MLSNLRFGLGLGRAPRLVVTTTPKPLASQHELMAEPRCGAGLSQMGEQQGEGGGYDRADALVWAVDRLIRDASATAPRVRVLGA